LISRRTFLKGVLAASAVGSTFGGYALAEPFRLRVTRYKISPPNWPTGLRVKLAVIADLHVIEPWMGLSRVAQIVARANALEPDAVLLLGDYAPSAGMQRWASRVGGGVIPPDDWARELGRLKAPLGTHAVLGNHDWWEDPAAQARGCGPTVAGLAMERAGIKVYENDAVRLEKQGGAFWLTGLGDQDALLQHGGHGVPSLSEAARTMSDRTQYGGVDDLPAMLQQVSDDAPVIMMAHEPDIFAQMGDLADRVSLTVSGHTHGGQVRLLGFAPMVPSQYGSRYAYGHVVEDGRNLVVSAGLGCSGLPLRFGAPPEIVLVELGGETA
jgi:uncharacterized protein